MKRDAISSEGRSDATSLWCAAIRRKPKKAAGFINSRETHMKKSLVCALALFIAAPGIVEAQAYYSPSYSYSYVYTNPYLGYQSTGQTGGYGCTILTNDLSYGSRGSGVSTLQSFLVSQHYPGDGAWMITGYFGRATEQAVRNFQAGRGLLQTGVVDWQTREAIRQASCGGAGYAYTASAYPYYSQQYPYQYNYPYGYGYTAPLRLDSLSAQSASAGSSITLYGSGFDSTYNTVHFGSNAASGAGAANGTSLSVVVPNLPSGVYNIYVTNARGTSNSLSFTSIGSQYTFYNYGNNYGYNYGYPYNYLPAQAGNYGCSNYSYPYGCY